MVSETSSAAGEGLGASGSGVGTLLRATRQRLNQDLKQVAQALRIRHPYLQAIEDGRIQDLPGPTYAVGFIRTYADYLGLDGEEVVRRFRAEAANLAGRPALSFPTPASEGRLPGGAVLLLALILGGAIYGGWYYYSAQHRPVAETVPEVPDRLSQHLPRDGASESKGDDAKNAPGPSAPAEPAPATPPASSPPAPAEAPSGMSAMGGMTGMAPIVGMEGMAGMAGMSGMEGMAAAPAAAAPAAAERGPQVFGQKEGEVRVVLRALDKTWIQVRDDKGNPIATRVLIKGDQYRLPVNVSGPKLAVGNAGGVEVLVDGQVARRNLGKSGAVRSDIALDPEALKSADGQ